MNHAPTDASVLIHSDHLCDEFEALFKQGQSPRIADFLSRVEAEYRDTLLRDLVALEVGLLAVKGETTSVEGLLQRYESLALPGTNREALRATIEHAIASTVNTKKFAAGLSSTSPWDGRRASAEVVLPQIDGFEIESVLGKGGMGVVFKAVRTSLGRTVALKMILDSAAATSEVLQRFAREAKAIAELNDPHFVQIYEFGEANGKPYMALEFAGGGSLEKYRQGEPQSVEFAARTVEVLARAMQKAHSIGLVHRDLKPHNVLLADDGTPKIADFGLVKRQDPDESAMTEQGKVMGTASYMAPEQTYSSHDVGPAADVYALGGILYCLLTGRPPFLGATALDTIFDVRNTEAVPPSRLRPKTPRDLEVICLACLEKEPHKRYSDATNLADDLRRYLDGRPITRRPVSTVERAWRWSKRNPLGAMVAALVAAIAVVSSLMSWNLIVTNNRLEIETANKLIARSNEEKARAKAMAEQAASNEQYNGVLWAYHRIFYDADTLLRNNSRDVVVRVRLTEMMLEELKKLQALRERKDDSTEVQPYDERNSLFERNEAIGHQRLGDIHLVTNNPKLALAQFDLAYHVIDEARREKVDEPVHNRNLAVICDKQADALIRLGETLKGREKYQEALQSRLLWDVKLRATGIDHIPAKTAIARSLFQLGRINLLLGDASVALDHLNHSKEWYAKAPANEVAGELVKVDHRLGEAHSQLGNIDEAERLLTQVADACVKAQQAKASDTNRRALARSRLELGDFYLIAKQDVPKAWSRYKLALDGYTRLWDKDKDAAETRANLANIEYRVGALLQRARAKDITLEDVSDGNDPQTHFERSCKLREELAAIDPDDMQAKIECALALARCGRAKEAEEQAEVLVKKGENNPRLLSQAAATFALCTQAGNEEIRARCNKRAYEVLDQLIKSGWKDRAALHDDPDLDPIRKEPRYQQLLASLQSPVASVTNDAEATSSAADQENRNK